MNKLKKILIPFMAAAVMMFGGMSTSVYADEYAEDDYYAEETNDYSDSEGGGSHLGTAFCISAVISLIVVMVMRSGMKTTRPEILADNYARDFKLKTSRDVFLYRKVEKTKRQQ